MSDVWEYRIAVSQGPLSASQLTNEFGADGWELVDIIKHEHAGEERVWNYFKREKVRPSVIEGVSSVSSEGGSMELGKGTDTVGVSKAGKVTPMKRKKKK